MDYSSEVRVYRNKSSNNTSGSGSASDQLFICFASRLSSSSMKLSSNCILSSGRSREAPQFSLSTSLSRRLKSNGGLKGGQASPMFPTSSTAKKKGSGFENPEPSSPKVTCIGQVRVKTKKHGRRFRMRSKRGEASFRGTEQNLKAGTNPDQSFQYQNLQQDGLPHRNQRWVHIPLTICEALRAFGAELILPCRSSCMSCDRGKEEKAAAAAAERSVCEDRRESSSGAVSRWLVSLQEDDGRGREIELVVGKEESAERISHSQRRHVFDELEFEEDNKAGKGMEEEQKSRVSVCIPPKNALLLMRCRSDPVKMAALANKFWESPLHSDENENENEDEDHGDNCVAEEQEQLEEDIEQVYATVESEANLESSEVNEEQKLPKAQPEAEAEPAELESENEIQEKPELSALHGISEEKHQQVVEVKEDIRVLVEETKHVVDLLVDPEQQLQEEISQLKEEENEEPENEFAQSSSLRGCKESASAAAVLSEDNELETEELDEEKEKQQELITERPPEDDEEAETIASGGSVPENSKPDEPKSGLESVVRECQPEREKTGLPDCLLLMMCEPKLSMEISKETWVCRADFIRCLPERSAKKIDDGGEPQKGIHVESHPPPQQRRQQQQALQPPRSSCSYPSATAMAPAPLSMATVIEKKLVGSNAYEPFVLTRCKSAPIRSSAKPEQLLWNKTKIEPHCPATFGIGAARVGC